MSPRPRIGSSKPIVEVYQPSLAVHEDQRGSVREIFRESWLGQPVKQMVHSESGPNVMRAMHSHKSQVDVWHFARGEAFVQTYDPAADTVWGRWADAGSTIIIPPGIAHGFYTPEGCTLIYGLTAEWDGSDEWEFDALDPAYPGHDLWPFATYVRSNRDLAAPSFETWLANTRIALAMAI